MTPARFTPEHHIADDGDEGIAVYDGRGSLLAANVRMTSYLADHTRGPALRRAIVSGVREAAAASAGCRIIRSVGAPQARLIVTRLAGGDADRNPAVVAVLRPQTAQVTPEALRRRFHLTERQLHVATLLAEGKPNKAIAFALGISPHTARHHTQQVLTRLRVRSRAEVAGILNQRFGTRLD
jgi:DNA-binding NarL/FixJ family response regulator